jgi:hypothetical protein
MAKRLANKQRLLLVVLIVAVALVAGRSARRRDAAPRPFPPPVPRRPVASPSDTAGEVPVPTGKTSLEPPASPDRPGSRQASVRPTASPGALAAMEPDSTTTTASPAEASPAEPVPGPFPGSVLPLADGGAPSPDFVIKGKTNSMRCHGPSSPYYGRTRAEVWFRTERDAVAAGFRPWAPKGQ